MRILITGGTGYVGGHLIDVLLEQQDQIISLTRKPSKNAKIDYYQYNGDIDKLNDIFNNFKPEGVIHLAADINKTVCQKTIDNMVDTNIRLISHLLELSKLHNIKRFINISTYSLSIDGETYSPQTFYAATKKAAEDLCEYYAMCKYFQVISLNLYDVYGPNQPHARFLNSLIQSIENGATFSMSKGEQEICLIYVDEVVSGIVHCLKDLIVENYHEHFSLYGKEVFKLKQLPDLIAGMLQRKKIPVIYDKPYRPFEVMKFKPLHALPYGWQSSVRLSDKIHCLLR